MRVTKYVVVLVVLGVLVSGGVYCAHRGKSKDASFQLATVQRDDLVATISATGTIEPEEVVDVGAQVAGLILAFGTDADGKLIDYGSSVDVGTVLARIDDSLYATDVSTAHAQLAQAKAGVARAEAELLQMKAKLDQASRDWDRAQKLGPSEALAQTTYDSYRAAHEVARANVAVSEATIQQQQTSIDQAEAALQRAQRNLAYCTITSPVKGVIIDRRVNIGQTVVSSLNAPSLFLIAKDLNRLQVWVAVNEADIGQIRPGQPVTFTVDAFQGRTFVGQVGKIRLNASMTQNVVTYTVEIVTDNSDGTLLPYLTANVSFEIDRRSNVLMVPNAALRWNPQPEQIAAGTQPKSDGIRTGAIADEPEARAEDAGNRTLWVLDGQFVRPLHVTTGLTDGGFTEISGEGVVEGLAVVVGEESLAAAKAKGSTNPFLPQFRRGKQGRAPK